MCAPSSRGWGVQGQGAGRSDSWCQHPPPGHLAMSHTHVETSLSSCLFSVSLSSSSSSSLPPSWEGHQLHHEVPMILT